MKDLIASAKHTSRERTSTFIWKSERLDINIDEYSKGWGEQIELQFSHNPGRKQYEASIRRVLWQPSDNFSVTMFQLFDRENYPSVVFKTTPAARYSKNNLALFEGQTLSALGSLAEQNETLKGLLARAQMHEMA